MENKPVKRKLEEEKEGPSSGNQVKVTNLVLGEMFSENSDGEDWDADCRTIPKRARSNSLIGFNLGASLQALDNYLPEDKRPLNMLMKANLKESWIKKKFHECWMNNTDFKHENIELSHQPFKYCIIDNFLENVAALDKVRLSFNEISWNKRKMDLYEFFQSKDLKHVSHPWIKKINDFFKKEVYAWMSELTDIKIEKISATCSFYSLTDFLLTHDDLQEDRAIAFIFYMTDPIPKSNEELWTENMGGRLLLHGKDENGKPGEVVKKILPKNNRLIFFKVTNESFHQVEEILTMDRCRYSINGWFHTKDKNPFFVEKEREAGTIRETIPYLAPIETEIQLQHWINSEYLNKKLRKQIQEQIEAESEVSLSNYFISEKFEDLCIALQNDEIQWKRVGPLNRNNYERLQTDNLPNIVKDFLELFQSKKMFRLFKDYTELDLVQSDVFKPTVKIELQRWTPGCYSLISDREDPHLDVIVYIGCDKPIVGGETLYVANDNEVEQALMSLEPSDNTMNIIFRDTSKFTRYISYKSQCRYFYTLVCAYKE